MGHLLAADSSFAILWQSKKFLNFVKIHKNWFARPVQWQPRQSTLSQIQLIWLKLVCNKCLYSSHVWDKALWSWFKMATLWSWVQTLDQVTRSKSAVSQVHLSRGLLSQVFAPVSVHTPWMQPIRTTYCMNDKWYAAEFWLLGVWGFFWGGRINMKTGTRSHWRCDLKSQQTPGC